MLLSSLLSAPASSPCLLPYWPPTPSTCLPLGHPLILCYLLFHTHTHPGYLCLCAPLPQVALVISAAEADGPVARGWRRSGGRSRCRAEVPYCHTAGRGGGRRPMQRWHIGNTIWDVQPLICSGRYRVVRGFVRVHVCLWLFVSVCVYLYVRRTAQAVTYTAAETTEGGEGADHIRGSGGGTWCCSDWLSLFHMYSHSHIFRHTYTLLPLQYTPFPLHAHTLNLWKQGERAKKENVLYSHPLL